MTLEDAVNAMAKEFMELDGGSTFSGMTCREATALADVFVQGKRMDAAAHVLMMHGEGDSEEGDKHRDVYLALQQPGAGFSHNEDDDPFYFAMGHARDLQSGTDTTLCRHSWVAGMMSVSDEDLDSVAAVRRVECERCEAVYSATV